MNRIWLLSALLATLLVPAQATQLVLYGITDTGALFTTNAATGATAGAGNISSANVSFTGLAWNGTDLFALGIDTVNITANLYRLNLNPTTFQAALASTISLGSAVLGALRISEGDFTFNSATTGYISSQNATRYDFLSFDTNLNSVTSLGGCSVSPCADGIGRNLGLDGLYWNSSDSILYGTQLQSTTFATTLDTVSTVNGARTQVAVSNLPTGTALGYGALTKDPLSNILYALNSGISTQATLYTVSTSGVFSTGIGLNGAVTQNVTGLAYAFVADPPAPGIPEPATIAAVLAGLSYLAYRRRRV